MTKTTVQISLNFLYTLPVAVAQSYSDDSAIRYVLPVLWVTSCFHITGEIARIKTTSTFLPFRSRDRQVAALGAKSAVSDYICLRLVIASSRNANSPILD